MYAVLGRYERRQPRGCLFYWVLFGAKQTAFHSPRFLRETTAWRQEVELRMEQSPMLGEMGAIENSEKKKGRAQKAIYNFFVLDFNLSIKSSRRPSLSNETGRGILSRFIRP